MGGCEREGKGNRETERVRQRAVETGNKSGMER